MGSGFFRVQAKGWSIRSFTIWNAIPAAVTELHHLTEYSSTQSRLYFLTSPNPSLGEAIADVPFPVSLHRGSLDSPHFPRESPLCGRFTVKYLVSGDLEQARAARLQKACEDKFPKLATWKRHEGARTVLVLEENDLSLTNHQRVADALAPVEAAMPDAPDEIFLVSTHIADKWWVTCLRRAGKTYYHDGERFHEIDPAALVPLTKR
jgi:hypothetical protein